MTDDNLLRMPHESDREAQALVPFVGQAPRLAIQDALPLARDFADTLSKSMTVPDAFRGKPEDIVAVLITANDLGIRWGIAFDHIFFVHGRKGLSAAMMRGLILSQGHELWWGDVTNTRAELFGQRRGSSHQSRVVWTMDDAKQAKLLGREDKKIWDMYPRAMLMARATGEMARANFSDVLLGLGAPVYVKEELEQGVWDREKGQMVIEGVVEPEQSGTRSTRRRAGRAVTGPVPPPPPDEAPPPTAEPPTVEGHFRPAPPPPDEAPPTPPPSRPDPSQAPAGQAQPGEGMTMAEKTAMACREAGIDRAELIRALTGKTSAREITREDAEAVLQTARAIGRGEKRLVEGRVEDVPPTPEEAEEPEPPPAKKPGQERFFFEEE